MFDISIYKSKINDSQYVTITKFKKFDDVKEYLDLIINFYDFKIEINVWYEYKNVQYHFFTINQYGYVIHGHVEIGGDKSCFNQSNLNFDLTIDDLDSIEDITLKYIEICKVLDVIDIV